MTEVIQTMFSDKHLSQLEIISKNISKTSLPLMYEN